VQEVGYPVVSVCWLYFTQNNPELLRINPLCLNHSEAATSEVPEFYHRYVSCFINWQRSGKCAGKCVLCSCCLEPVSSIQVQQL